MYQFERQKTIKHFRDFHLDAVTPNMMNRDGIARSHLMYQSYDGSQMARIYKCLELVKQALRHILNESSYSHE